MSIIHRSKFRNNSCVIKSRVSVLKSRSAVFDVDQFSSSDFFLNESGQRLSDVMVFAAAEADPELRQKIQESLIVSEYDSLSQDLSPEQALKTIRSRYTTPNDVLARLDALIADGEYKAKSGFFDKPVEPVSTSSPSLDPEGNPL